MGDEARNASFSRFPRAGGLLLHPTSLPSRCGIGDFGPAAYQFVDFLARAGQQLWQLLPLGPTGFGDSPYAARSAFAGNPLLISPEILRDEGLIDSSELDALPPFREERVDYAAVAVLKDRMLRRAAARAATDGPPWLRDQLESFRSDQREWLDDFTLFMALRDQFDRNPWQRWPSGLRARDPRALEQARRSLADEVAYHRFAQFLFWRQWSALHQYAAERHVQIVGDLPIFVAHDSADVWANQELFHLDSAGNPTVVAGVPPDYFSSTGQRWGNPLYRWDRMAEDGFRWWIARFRMLLRTVDIVRIDHFRGFCACWEIPASESTAVNGRWVEVPGDAVFCALRDALGSLPIIVEDLGYITPDVVALRQRLGYPGMKVLQFAWDSGPTNPFLPHNFEPNCVVYTGTHDNDTTLGWFRSATPAERAHATQYMGVSGEDIAWDLIRLAFASVADLAIVPVQDVLSLDTDARMNFPGRAEGNWAWRLRHDQLRDEHADRLRHLSTTFGRVR